MKNFAFVFPGQGSQSVGMLDGWGDHPAVLATLQEASDALGQDVGQLIRSGSKEELALTTNTQPVMLVAGVAAYRAWRAEGGAAPQVMAGHSLGEYTAWVASGALSLADAAPLVRFRAQCMQEAVPVGAGAMAAILGMPSTEVVEGCREVQARYAPDAGEVVEAVNFNDPSQTVIAGTQAAVAQACEWLKSKGAKRALPLPVSAPFHSSLMKPAALRLRERLAATPLAAPQVPVVNNVDVRVESDADAIRDALFRQVDAPVRWVETIRLLRAQGVGHVVECGPGKVLAGLVKRIDPELNASVVADPQTLAQTLESLA